MPRRSEKKIARKKIKLSIFSHQNKCCFNMCYNNATCLVGFTNKGYKCLCPPGYTGEHCEKGKSYFARAL